MGIIPQNKYCEILEAVPICCVDVLICHGGKVLLLRRKNKPAKEEWWPPGGRVHKHELLESAAVRKSYEETGLRVDIKSKIGVYETMFNDGPFSDLKGGVHTINICFLAEPISDNPEVVLDSTHSDYKWVDKIPKEFPVYIRQLLKDSGIFKR